MNVTNPIAAVIICILTFGMPVLIIYFLITDRSR